MKRSYRNLIVFSLILIISPFLVFQIAGLLWNNSNFVCFGTLFPVNHDIETRAYLKFPSTAQNIEYHTNAVNRKAGCTIWVKFQIDSKDFPIVKNATYIENFSATERFADDAFVSLSGEQGWTWPVNSLAGRGKPPSGASGFPTSYEDQWVYVDTTNPHKWIVYVIVNKEWI